MSSISETRIRSSFCPFRPFNPSNPSNLPVLSSPFDLHLVSSASLSPLFHFYPFSPFSPHMDLMSSRFRFNFRNKKNPPPPPIVPASTSPSSPPSGHSSSTTSLPMNQPPGGLGRPPSYTMNNRPTSPMVQHGQHPAPTNAPYNQPGVPMNTAQGYGMQQQQQQVAPSIPTTLSTSQYPGRNPAVEVEGGGRGKAQLIVGIDFGTTFSGVAFAFATNNEAREDIITEWPGAGTHTKQKVSMARDSRTRLI